MNPAALHLAILRTAALLVPEQQRAEWLAEWNAELWHAAQDPPARNVTVHCLGAFRDANWFRRYGPVPRSYGVLHIDVPSPPAVFDSFSDDDVTLLASPARCLSFLGIAAALAISIAFLLPAVRPLVRPPSYSSARNFARSKAYRLRLAGIAIPAGSAPRLILARVFPAGSIPADASARPTFLPARFWLLPGLLSLFIVGSLVAVITTSLSLGDYPAKCRPRQWLFLAAKILLVLPIVVFGSLDLAGIGSSLSPGVFDLPLFGGLFFTRWILADQRKRCPVCLRLLSKPVRIGQSSRMFLEWHGTELICLQGHGILHVPERPAIWFTSQRWMDLDPSWSGLFP